MVLSNFNMNARAQQKAVDTMQGKELEQVVITATKTTRKIKDIPAPVTVIKGSAIEKMGSLRLNEVLSELTGVQIVRSTEGNLGVQMQGLNSEYILILIDGEPLIGRVNNVLDLTRITVNNIERIEIIKGPSSSLFGSEALGGVINIITKSGAVDKFHGYAQAVYRKYNVLDISAEAGEQKKKAGWYLFADRQHGNGYFAKGSTDAVTKTVAPYTTYTFNGKFSLQLNARQKLSVSSKYYDERQSNRAIILNASAGNRIASQWQYRKDLSITPAYTYTISEKQKLQLHNYTTLFSSATLFRHENNNELYSDTRFRQLFNRIEAQYDYKPGQKHLLTIGIGDAIETVKASDYIDGNYFNQLYIFGQDQFQLIKDVSIIAGFRYDKHNQYRDRFSPKLAAEWKVTPQLGLYTNIAGGYKAPTFEQLLLNFTNPTVGYTVLGTNAAKQGLKALTDEGQIQTVLIEPGDNHLKAESSVAINAGAKYNPVNGLWFSLNIFRNNIRNLIDFNTIAIKTNRSSVYSYFNHNRVFTQGLELQADHTIAPGLSVSAGYQYLVAKDKDVLEQIKKGEMYYRDAATQTDHKVTASMYGGLYNRSKHSGNMKLEYSNAPYKFDVSLRCIYRGRYGSGADVNGNLILDDKREYAPGYVLLNLTVRKKIRSFILEAGCNNLTGTINELDTSIIPFNWFAGTSVKF
ncbi:MAG: TonB-dependent receptor [Chitinophagaceae bacterium]|nr:TonB-dependent receptor [Chitinophagaceae bacterium]